MLGRMLVPPLDSAGSAAAAPIGPNPNLSPPPTPNRRPQIDPAEARSHASPSLCHGRVFVSGGVDCVVTSARNATVWTWLQRTWRTIEMRRLQPPALRPRTSPACCEFMAMPSSMQEPEQVLVPVPPGLGSSRVQSCPTDLAGTLPARSCNGRACSDVHARRAARSRANRAHSPYRPDICWFNMHCGLLAYCHRSPPEPPPRGHHFNYGDSSPLTPPLVPSSSGSTSL